MACVSSVMARMSSTFLDHCCLSCARCVAPENGYRQALPMAIRNKCRASLSARQAWVRREVVGVFGAGMAVDTEPGFRVNRNPNRVLKVSD